MSDIDDSARHRLARLTRLLYRRALTELCGGNASIRVGELAYMTPTYASEYFWWRLEPHRVLVSSLDGTLRAGRSEHLSREADLHLRIYRERPEVRSVFHLHDPIIVATATHLEAMTATTRFGPWLDKQGISMATLPRHLEAQTAPHDDLVMELLAGMATPVKILVGEEHGLFTVGTDVAGHVRAVDSLNRRLQALQVLAATQGQPA